MVNPKMIDSINPKILLKSDKNKVIVLDAETDSEGGKTSAQTGVMSMISCHKRKKETVVEAIDKRVSHVVIFLSLMKLFNETHFHFGIFILMELFLAGKRSS